MPESKKHHFVPQLILREFADANLKFFSFLKSERRIFSEGVPDAYQHSNFYTWYNQDQSRATHVEKHFSAIETAFAPLHQRLLELAKRESRIDIHSNDVSVIQEFVFHQMRRVPDLLNKAFNKTPEASEKAKEELEEYYPELNFDALFQRPHMLQNIKVLGLETRTGELLDIISQLKVNLAIPERIQKTFVIGSNPVVSGGLLDAKDPRSIRALWLPISPRVAIFLDRESDSQIVRLTDSEMRNFNLTLLSKSSKISSSHRSLLESLAKPR